jgi:RNA polymerase sigma-70 factor (ECF subfamily)
VLSRYEGFSYKEIAEELNISVKTVETQMSKALAKLRVELKEYLPFLLFLSPKIFF